MIISIPNGGKIDLDTIDWDRITFDETGDLILESDDPVVSVRLYRPAMRLNGLIVDGDILTVNVQASATKYEGSE